MLTISLSELSIDFSIRRLHELRLALRKLKMDDAAVTAPELVRAFGMMGAINLLCSIPRLETTMRMFGASVLRRMASIINPADVEEDVFKSLAVMERYFAGCDECHSDLRSASAVIERTLCLLNPLLMNPVDASYHSLRASRRPLNLTESQSVIYHLCLLFRVRGYEPDAPWYAIHDMYKLLVYREAKTPMALLNFIVQFFRRLVWIPRDDDNMFEVLGPSPFSVEKKFLDATSAELICHLGHGLVDPEGARKSLTQSSLDLGDRSSFSHYPATY